MKAHSVDPALEFYTVPQAAAVLQVGVKTIYSLIKSGRLRAVKLGRRGDLRIRPPWLTEFAEREQIRTTATGLRAVN